VDPIDPAAMTADEKRSLLTSLLRQRNAPRPGHSPNPVPPPTAAAKPTGLAGLGAQRNPPRPGYSPRPVDFAKVSAQLDEVRAAMEAELATATPGSRHEEVLRQQLGLPPARPGPGSHLKAILAKMGVPPCQSCAEYAAQMDGWGVAGCRERLEEIVAHLEAEAKRLGWARWLAAGGRAVVLGIPKAPRGLAEEAIRRAAGG
jgi:hypothetical protein